jgi:hypothetical protein
MSGSQHLLLGAVPQVASDPNFEYTTLLLPGNGTNGAQNNTFLDSSTNNFAITRNGNTTQGTFSPFSQTGWSNYFDGSGDYLTTPSNAAFGFGTGDITIECWYYQLSRAVSNTIFANESNTLNIYINTSGVLGYYDGSVRNSSQTVPLNSWNHIAFVRSSGTAKLYFNGTEVLSVANSINYGTAYVSIGNNVSGTDYCTGYISNLRVVKGTAVYTANFTPPTAPLTAVAGTSILTCQSNRIRDASTNNFAITVVGNTSVQAFSPFNPTAAWSAATNGGSGYFDGSGDYLNTSSTQVVPSGSFTVEAWAYPTSSANSTVVAQGTSGNAARFSIGIESSLWWTQIGGVTINAGTPVLNAWTHLAATFNGSTLTLYVNGVSVGTASTSTNAQNTTLRIGSLGPADWSTYYWTGYIGQIRVSNTVRSISVPTAPYTSDANTAFLGNFTNAGIYDATSKNDLETVGNAQISTTQSKFGGSSMYFDGTGDYLYRANNPNVLGSGDWTIEGWYYQAGGSGYRVFVSTRTAADGGVAATVFFGLFNNVLFYDGSTSGGISIVGGTSISASTWNHVALVRYGSTVTMYLNGVSQGTATDSNNKSNADLWVGGQNTLYYLNGYIDDLRITKGIARYTAAFTPPTTAFPLL